jgi:hypothetical protein
MRSQDSPPKAPDRTNRPPPVAKETVFRKGKRQNRRRESAAETARPQPGGARIASMKFSQVLVAYQPISPVVSFRRRTPTILLRKCVEP